MKTESPLEVVLNLPAEFQGAVGVGALATLVILIERVFLIRVRIRKRRQDLLTSIAEARLREEQANRDLQAMEFEIQFEEVERRKKSEEAIKTLRSIAPCQVTDAVIYDDDANDGSSFAEDTTTTDEESLD